MDIIMEDAIGEIIKLQNEEVQYRIDQFNLGNKGEIDNSRRINEIIESNYILAAPGRSGGDWISSEAKKLNINTRFAPIDIGVRIEVPAVLMESIIDKAWDPKFHIFTKTYDDFTQFVFL